MINSNVKNEIISRFQTFCDEIIKGYIPIKKAGSIGIQKTIDKLSDMKSRLDYIMQSAIPLMENEAGNLIEEYKVDRNEIIEELREITLKTISHIKDNNTLFSE